MIFGCSWRDTNYYIIIYPNSFVGALIQPPTVDLFHPFQRVWMIRGEWNFELIQRCWESTSFGIGSFAWWKQMGT